ncbi:molybdopterin adenylyltransferase [Polynucleobacter necessarius]|uniref:molybdopterin adenylyltransferase n=1 Tax=Polynucleobacter necessarius TaxID=576610 RepID=UPI000E08FA2D|nr:molybdopterin adenylyltransferase [Polynucleobacter necessarius]
MKHTEAWKRSSPDEIKIGLISISDRASKGIYTDEGVPALRSWLESALSTPYIFHERLIADEREVITETIVELTDDLGCDLVLTTGGTGPSRRDVTPEATMDAGTREMPGFGEQMRQISLRFVPTAILSQQTAVLREIEGHTALVINLPGQPKSIKETLEGLKDAEGKSVVQGIFASVPYCIELFGGPIIQTHESVIKVYRPKSAVKK